MSKTEQAVAEALAEALALLRRAHDAQYMPSKFWDDEVKPFLDRFQIKEQAENV